MNYLTPPIHVLIGSIVTVAAVTGAVYSYNSQQPVAVKSVTPYASTRPAASTTLTGRLWCLPHNAPVGAPTTLECAIGLKGDDGRYYALSGLPPSSKNVVIESPVKVTGSLSAAGTDEMYAVSGTVHVSSFTAL